jgi:hypothetical protein
MNHRLPVEQGRFWGFDRDDRICDLICNSSELRDEFHYLLQCSYFSNESCKMLPYDVYTRPNTDKFKDFLCTDDYITLVKLARFCKIILSVIN